MKKTHLRTPPHNGAKRIIGSLVLAVAIIPHYSANGIGVLPYQETLLSGLVPLHHASSASFGSSPGNTLSGGPVAGSLTGQGLGGSSLGAGGGSFASSPETGSPLTPGGRPASDPFHAGVEFGPGDDFVASSGELTPPLTLDGNLESDPSFGRFGLGNPPTPPDSGAPALSGGWGTMDGAVASESLLATTSASTVPDAGSTMLLLGAAVAALFFPALKRRLPVRAPAAAGRGQTKFAHRGYTL